VLLIVESISINHVMALNDQIKVDSYVPVDTSYDFLTIFIQTERGTATDVF